MADSYRTLHRGGGSAIGGRGFDIDLVWDEAAVKELFVEHGPVAGWLDGVIGPAVVQEAKRRAPVSPEGNYGRPSGYLRSSIGQDLGADADGVVHIDVGADAFTPDGTDYGLIMEVGSAPHVIESHGDYPLRDEHGNVFGRAVNHPGTKPYNYLRGSLSILR